jgi:hypothetical protein
MEQPHPAVSDWTWMAHYTPTKPCEEQYIQPPWSPNENQKPEVSLCSQSKILDPFSAQEPHLFGEESGTHVIRISLSWFQFAAGLRTTMAQMVVCLPSKCKVLSSNPTTTNKKQESSVLNSIYLWGSKTNICRDPFAEDCSCSPGPLLLDHQTEEGLGGHDVEMVCPTWSNAAVTVSPVLTGWGREQLGFLWLLLLCVVVGFFLAILEFDLRVLHFLSKCLITWATATALKSDCIWGALSAGLSGSNL